ncbi:MAG: glycoside hydrolase family 172 protein [bacterium]
MMNLRKQNLNQTRILLFSILVVTFSWSGVLTAFQPLDRKPVLGIEELCRLDLLPRMKQSVSVGCVSSYDRTGGNDDGFSGKYSFIRKEPGGLVIADLQGPGIIYRIHTPLPTENIIEFYFDGESTPRIRKKVTELFDGAHPPFLKPLVGSGVGGHYSYIPIQYQKSCKILMKAEEFYFYQINYARYADNTVIQTFQDPPSEAFLRRVEEAGNILLLTGSDISTHLVPEGTRIETKTVRQVLKPGRKITLFETSSPGRIVGLKLSPTDAFAGKDKDILIRMVWDGNEQPAVNCPVSDFFGYSFGEPAVRSLFLGTSSGENYIYLPMPFERSARIELISEKTSGPEVEIKAEVKFARLKKFDDEGRFYARWHRENPTREGVPHTYLKTTGQGHVIGTILQAQGMESGSTPFFEGDDRAVIDGELAIPGTGTEDSFNGGWYDVPGRWENRASFPLSGCLDYKKPLARTGGYRWMVTDAYPYTKSIDFTVEHSPEGNKEPTDYTSVTFFYSLESPPPEAPLLPVADRRISDPKRIVFVPGWNVPIHTSSLRNATWTKESSTIGDSRVRHLSMKTSGEDIFGPHHISFICDLPSAGHYKIGIKAVKGPDQGIVQIFQYDHPVGDSVNLYAENRMVSPLLPLGILKMDEGDNIVFLNLVGKDDRSAGLGLDLVELVFERVK